MHHLSQNAREWFRFLLDAEIGNERSTVDSETEWETGSPTPEERYAHRMNAQEHSDYIQFLEELKARYCGAS